jgi:hypothetical protein
VASSDVVGDLGPTSLTSTESVLLGYALVDAVAEALDVRCLAIKGPVLAAQGLREERNSVDVDVLVDPSAFASLLERMVALGWVDTEPYDLPTVMPRHSSTLRHTLWACEVDLHHYFPGFLAEPQVVFNALWEVRSRVEVAGRPVRCPSVEGSAMVAALHYLRDAQNEAARARLSALPERLRALPASRREELLRLSVATGSDATLQPLWEALQMRVSVPRTTAGLDLWRLRSGTSTTASLAWWVDLQRAPWLEKPSRLRRAMWPRAADAHLFFGREFADARELRRARIARLRRGVREVPQAIREARRVKRSQDR